MTIGHEFPELEKEARKIGKAIASALRPGEGFTLFIFDYGEGGGMSYISSAQRDDMLKALKEFIAKVESE